MRPPKRFLTVLIPAYNESARLLPTLARVREFIAEQKLDAEILVVDDGSTDDTAAIAEKALRGGIGRVLSNPGNRGKGYSVRHGILEAAGRWVLFSDADLSTPIEDYLILAAAARDRDRDIVFGSRALHDSNVEVEQNPLRKLMGQTFNKVMKLLSGLPYKDTQCGFKLLDTERVRPLVEKMVVDRFAFDVELLFLGMRYGLSLEEVPVTWRNAEGSKVSILGDPLDMLKDLIRIRLRFRKGLYNRDPVEGSTP